MAETETVQIRITKAAMRWPRAGDTWEIDGEPHRVVKTELNVGASESWLILERRSDPYRDLQKAVRQFRDEVAKVLLDALGKAEGEGTVTVHVPEETLTTCGAPGPDSGYGDRYVCTRPAEHDGDHGFVGKGAIVQWPRGTEGMP